MSLERNSSCYFWQMTTNMLLITSRWKAWKLEEETNNYTRPLQQVTCLIISSDACHCQGICQLICTFIHKKIGCLSRVNSCLTCYMEGHEFWPLVYSLKKFRPSTSRLLCLLPTRAWCMAPPLPKTSLFWYASLWSWHLIDRHYKSHDCLFRIGAHASLCCSRNQMNQSCSQTCNSIVIVLRRRKSLRMKSMIRSLVLTFSPPLQQYTNN